MQQKANITKLIQKQSPITDNGLWASQEVTNTNKNEDTIVNSNVFGLIMVNQVNEVGYCTIQGIKFL